MTTALALAVSVLGIVAVFLQGKHHWQGWALAFASEALFIGLVVTEAEELSGVLLASTFFACLYARNAWEWWKESHG